MDKKDKLIVETKYVTFDNLILESGKIIAPVEIAYETYGNLNSEKNNAILILHAFSGDAHAAGFHKDAKKPGWWDNMIGSGKAFDTDKYFVICSNVLGGCKGTTGPSSRNPITGKPYALDFPLITIKDMVNLQKKLIDFLGVKKILTVTGGSMGGMQALQWVVLYPEIVLSSIPIATTMKHSPQQIAFNEVGRQAILADPNWNHGDYYGKNLPSKGLAIARMVGHITYMSDLSMKEKFGRRYQNKDEQTKFQPEFEVEGYLKYKGNSFVERFDANSYLYITKALDYFDITNGIESKDLFKGINTKFLIISFNSDWLYPTYQSLEIVKACREAGIHVVFHEVDYSYGHDSFLIETNVQTTLISNYLRDVCMNVA
jgi:homoserine O-acetyltransferase